MGDRELKEYLKKSLQADIFLAEPSSEIVSGIKLNLAADRERFEMHESALTECNGRDSGSQDGFVSEAEGDSRKDFADMGNAIAEAGTDGIMDRIVSSLEWNHMPRLQETICQCIDIMRDGRLRRDPRTGFVQYLSDVFHFEGIPILGLQAIILLFACLVVMLGEGELWQIPACMPLFVFAVVPTMFKCRYFGMSEIEAVTRASGAQIVLAKLILAGAANLVGMTIFILLEVHFFHYYDHSEIGRMILYCLVPYLVCMTCMLRLLRLQKRESMQLCTVMIPIFCAGWGISAKILPWLYEISAFGLWIIAFLFFGIFFAKEIYWIITMRKEGKMYGVIA